MNRIPFNRASLAGDEFRYISEALARGHISGDGGFTRRYSQRRWLCRVCC